MSFLLRLAKDQLRSRSFIKCCANKVFLGGSMTAIHQRTRQFRLESSFRRCTLNGYVCEWPELGGSSFEPCPDDQRFARYRLHPAKDTG
jgi:hypothetical protein